MCFMPLKLCGRVGGREGGREGREGGYNNREKKGGRRANYPSPVVCHKGTVRGSPVARYSQCSLAYAIVW